MTWAYAVSDGKGWLNPGMTDYLRTDMRAKVRCNTVPEGFSAVSQKLHFLHQSCSRPGSCIAVRTEPKTRPHACTAITVTPLGLDYLLIIVYQ